MDGNIDPRDDAVDIVEVVVTAVAAIVSTAAVAVGGTTFKREAGALLTRRVTALTFDLAPDIDESQYLILASCVDTRGC